MTATKTRRRADKTDTKARQCFDEATVQIVQALLHAEDWLFTAIEAGAVEPAFQKDLRGFYWAIERFRGMIEDVLSVEAREEIQREREYIAVDDEELVALTGARRAAARKAVSV
jgi:hypothetical protein